MKQRAPSCFLLLLALAAACEPPAGAGARPAQVAQDKSPQSRNEREITPKPATPTASAAPHASALARKPHAPRPAPVSGAAFASPPPWPDAWCVDHAAVWRLELEKKHALAPKSSSHGPGCNWAWDSFDGNRRLGIGMSAGTVGGNFAAQQRPKASFDPLLGTAAVFYTDKDDVLLRTWSTEPPFHLGAVADGFGVEEGKARIRALAKDVLDGIDPKQFLRPKAELVFIYPNFPDRAKAVLEHWSQLQPIFDAALPLATGFPKLVHVDDFEWDPGKRPGEDWRWERDKTAPPTELVLTAICPAGAGERVVEMTRRAFPLLGNRYVGPIATYVAHAEGLSIECPKAAQTQPGSPKASRFWPRPDGSVLRAVTATEVEAAPGATAFYGAVFLTDAKNTPLDYLPFELHKPELLSGAEHASNPVVRIGKCDDDLDPDYSDQPKARLVCEAFRRDPRCRVPEYLGTELYFHVVDGKVRAEETPLAFPGRDCSAGQ